MVYDNKYVYKQYSALGLTEERRYFYKKIGDKLNNHWIYNNLNIIKKFTVF